MSSFNIPVVLIMFKRTDTTLQILERIRMVRPNKLYLISDSGRDEDEQVLVEDTRRAVESSIDWKCDLVKNYAEENRGVHAQIGLGAKWVFEREHWAIFLEDDNLPELTFFTYCEKCLKKYEKDESVFWICGTNYLEKCTPRNGASVFASRHLMPCGWASWADKFNKYYDSDMQFTQQKNWEMKLREGYKDKRLYRQQLRSIRDEAKRKSMGERYRSWDYHTVLSMRTKNLIGIVPKVNQIKNIGVDDFSTHGGNSMALEMTKRFCGIVSYSLEEPIVLPDACDLDMSFERRIGRIILFPFKNRMILFIRDLLRVPEGIRLREFLLGRTK